MSDALRFALKNSKPSRGWLGRFISGLGMIALGQLSLASPATAQQAPTRGWQVEYFDWQVHAAVTNNHVVGFLAVLNEEAATGNNVKVVWMQPEANGVASMWGWSGNNTQEVTAAAVQWASDHTGDPSLWSSNPELSPSMLLDTPASAPIQIESGLFVNDTIDLGMVDPEIRPLFAESLASKGYAAAPTLSAVSATTPDSLTSAVPGVMAPENLLANLTYLAETDLLGSSTAVVVVGDWDCWCPCTTTYTTVWVPATPPFVERPGNRLCMWIGTRTYTKNCHGLYFWSCSACITSTVTTSTVYGDLTGLPGVPCVDPYLFPPTEYTVKPLTWP